HPPALLSFPTRRSSDLLALCAWFFLYADLRRRGSLAAPHAGAGLFLGMGAFQLFVGLVDHKLLRLHQIRYGVDVTPYDVAWNLAGLVLLLTGAGLAVRAARRHDDGGQPE